MLAKGDVLLAITYGGETQEILNLLDTLKRLEIPIVLLTGKPKSTLAEASDVVVDVSVKEEACTLNLAPTASTTVAMAIGDALAISLLERRGFQSDDFAVLHPAGRLGKKLLRVEHLMHSGDSLPRVSPETLMPAVFHEMSAKKLGMTTVTGTDGKLGGNPDRRRFAPIDGKTWRSNAFIEERANAWCSLCRQFCRMCWRVKR